MSTENPNGDYTRNPDIKRTDWERNITDAIVAKTAAKFEKAKPTLTVTQELLLKIKQLNTKVESDVTPMLKLLPIMDRDIAMDRMLKAYREHLASWSLDDMRELCALVLAAKQTENLPSN